MNSDGWDFDKERMEELEPEERRRLYIQMVRFRLDELEKKTQELTKDIERLEGAIARAQNRILMREIETFLGEN